MIESKSTPKKQVPKILIASLTILIVLVVSYSSYYYFTNRINFNYLSSINKIKSQIENENKAIEKILGRISTTSFSDQKEINNIIVDIKACEQSFDKFQDSVNNITPPEKYTNNHKQLIEAVRNNKKILTQARLILNNLKSTNISNAIEDFNAYIKDTQLNYDNAKIVKIKLPDNFYTFPDSLKTFAYKYYEAYDKKNRLYEQYQNYFADMDAIINQFINVKVNLSTYLDKLKNNEISTENINIEIEKRLILLEDVKNIYLHLSAPEKVVETHTKFDYILETFELYCRDFKANLMKLENTDSDETKLLEISQKFEELEKNYNQLTEDWMSFLDIYNNIKSQYSDISNI